LSVKIVGQNRRSNLSVKLLVKSVRRIAGSNCWSKSWIKFLDQICWSNAANQTQPIHAPPLASLGQCMGAPAHGPKTGKDGRETGKEKAALCGRGLCWLGVIRSSWEVFPLSANDAASQRHRPVLVFRIPSAPQHKFAFCSDIDER
jgi:hypothetical protein